MVFSHEKKQNWFSFRALGQIASCIYWRKNMIPTYKLNIKLVEFSAYLKPKFPYNLTFKNRPHAKSCLSHTSQDSFYKWTKISSLEINIFDLKMMVKSGLEFLFLNSLSPFRVAADQCKKICPERLNWPGRYLRRGSVNFKIKNSRPLFTIILSKKCQFQDSRFQSTYGKLV